MASDITVETLKDIRDEMRSVREEVRGMRGEQVQINHRMDVVKTTLLDLTDQQRWVVRYLRDKLESK